MSTVAAEILEQVRKLPIAERREIFEALRQETEFPANGRAKRSVRELKSFRPTPYPNLNDHDSWFAEAILASKGGTAPE